MWLVDGNFVKGGCPFSVLLMISKSTPRTNNPFTFKIALVAELFM